MKREPAFVANIMGDDEHMKCEVDRIRRFAEEQGVPTPNWDQNWHSCFEHTIVDAWADLEEDFLAAGYTVVRADNGDWILYSPNAAGDEAVTVFVQPDNDHVGQVVLLDNDDGDSRWGSTRDLRGNRIEVYVFDGDPYA